MNGEPFAGPIPKPERRSTVAKREKRQRFVQRRQCRAEVYQRERMICQRCGRLTKLPSECDWGGDPAMAHVNEIVPRSLGGSAIDMDNLELLCGGSCHMPNGEHAPTAERMARLQELRERRA